MDPRGCQRVEETVTETVGEQMKCFFPYLSCLYKRRITSRHRHVCVQQASMWLKCLGRGVGVGAGAYISIRQSCHIPQLCKTVAQRTLSPSGPPFHACRTVFLLRHRGKAICPLRAKWSAAQWRVPGSGTHRNIVPLCSVGWGKGDIHCRLQA